jgi:hypothetical protein
MGHCRAVATRTVSSRQPIALEGTPVSTLRPLPYVGISGLISPRQQMLLENLATEAGLAAHRSLLLGVKAAHKTQYLDIENKYGEHWYPVGHDSFAGALRSLSEDRPAGGPHAGLGVAQLYLDIDHVADPRYREQFLARVATRGAGWLQGLQFDLLPWHTDPDMLDFLVGIRKLYDIPVLLQCHGPAMDALGPQGTARALARLAPGVDYVLFDSSHDTGRRLDIAACAPFLEQTYDEPDLAEVGIAVAGGLDPETVGGTLPTLLRWFPDLSWDAERALHPTTRTGIRPLDLRLAADYLRASAALFGTTA